MAHFNFKLTNLVTAFCLIAPNAAFADENRTDFRCTFTEQCGSLKGASCFDPGAGFLLFHEKAKGFSIVMYNEVWKNHGSQIPSSRKDLTTLSFDAPSGEIALLTVDGEWNYALTIHYTGQSNTLNWESATGQCTAIKE